MLAVVGEGRVWEDPAVVSVNRLPMHVPLSGFERLSLDGRWNLELFERPDAVPIEALVGDRTDATGVEVPGNWTMQQLHLADGSQCVDLPHYTNVKMPFEGPPPRLPERNTTGVYRRLVTLPSSWQGQRVVLHVGGAESVHAVYINGDFVGYGTDSRLPSEYDLTPQLHDDEGTWCHEVELAIVVIRYSAHSYIEDQDQWWMAGLHRSVWLESRQTVQIADLPIATDFDSRTQTGQVQVRADVDFGTRPENGWSVRFTLCHPTGAIPGEHEAAQPSGDLTESRSRAPVGAALAQAHLHQHQLVDAQQVVSPVEPATRHPRHCQLLPGVASTGFGASAVFEVKNARAWTAETPHLYTLVTELLDDEGSVRHVEAQRVGLRRVEVRDGQLLVNDRAIRIFGVNRHDHHPDRGKAVTLDDIRADFTMMRRHNINAIRTSHYPNRSEFYELCDELGFYVFDEANIESHAYEQTICEDPQYRSAMVERARMVQRDRNHACVVVWSLGNESGYGTVHDALAGWIRTSDPTRPLHYEPAIDLDGWETGGKLATDIVCPMYPPIEAIRAYGEKRLGTRPLIMCEYSHAMGNSNGSLAEYWDVIEANPDLQGGFLWEWKDQALRQRLADGRVRLACGGHFDDEPNDGNFVDDGLMSADLEPHPAMREVAWVYRPVTVSLTSDRVGLLVENRRAFRGLDDINARWKLIHDGQEKATGLLDCPRVKAGATVRVPLPNTVSELLGTRSGANNSQTAADGTPSHSRLDFCGNADGSDVEPGELQPRGECHLTVLWETVNDGWFAPAGHLVAWDQVCIREARSADHGASPREPAPHQRANLPEGNGAQPESPTLGDLVGPQLNLWRAATDNDGFKLMPHLREQWTVGGRALWRWFDQGLNHQRAESLVEHQVEVNQTFSGTEYRHMVRVPEALEDLPRVGVMFEVPERFNALRWFGRGPHENYPDRKRSATLGIWSQQPDELPYLVPQEFGLRCDCRWFELIDPEQQQAIRIEALEPRALHFSATRHSAAELFAASEQHELPQRTGLVVCVDVAHRGLGTASCGPAVLPQYRVDAGRYEISYRVSLTRADASNC